MNMQSLSWVENTVKGIINGQLNFHYSHGYWQDMEKLKEAEENLRHLEQRVQTNTKAEERQMSEENKEHNEEVQLLKQQLEVESPSN